MGAKDAPVVAVSAECGVIVIKHDGREVCDVLVLEEAGEGAPADLVGAVGRAVGHRSLVEGQDVGSDAQRSTFEFGGLF